MAGPTTLAAAETQYLANADYESDSSGTTALAFLAACRAMLVLRKSSYSVAGRTVTHSELKDEARVCETWMDANNLRGKGGLRVGLASFGRPG